MLKVIKTDQEYMAALSAIEKLIDDDPEPNTPESNQLEVLSILISDYESKHYSIEPPTPLDAIKFRMEQQNLTQRDLIPIIGNRSKVSEILSGKRPLSLSMIRALHNNLGIPAGALLSDQSTTDTEELEIEWERFPIREMIKRGWINANLKTYKQNTREILHQYFSLIGSPKSIFALNRASEHIRSGRNMDNYALTAWTARVMIKAQAYHTLPNYSANTVTLDFMKKLAQLSWSDRGPLLAQEYLFKHGIPLIIEGHLPKTYLDGAAIFTKERPIIGLTLRYDRIDNFWFCLMHELAHIALHINQGVSQFFDDLDINHQGNQKEKEADQLAGEALIPKSEWEQSPVSKLHSPEAVQLLANKLQIHPAIIAGKIRYENNSYKKLKQFIGLGQVRSLFIDNER